MNDRSVIDLDKPIN